jgi:hypothetical protein
MRGKALFDFAAQAPNQISLKKDQIYVLHVYNPGGWFNGDDPSTGKSGFFPSDCAALAQPPVDIYMLLQLLQ